MTRTNTASLKPASASQLEKARQRTKTCIDNAPMRNVDKISFLPCASPSRLQKPVEIALKTLMVVTIATWGVRLGIDGGRNGAYRLGFWQLAPGRRRPRNR